MGLDLDFGISEFNAWESEMYNPVEDQQLFEAPSRITTISPEDGTAVKTGGNPAVPVADKSATLNLPAYAEHNRNS